MGGPQAAHPATSSEKNEPRSGEQSKKRVRQQYPEGWRPLFHYDGGH